MVGIDAVSDGLKEVMLLASEKVLAGPLWLDIGPALACSTWTPVLAWALGAVALRPRRAKLIVREILEGGRMAVAGFNAGLVGDWLFVETGLFGVVTGDASSLRGPLAREI